MGSYLIFERSAPDRVGPTVLLENASSAQLGETLTVKHAKTVA